MQKDYPYDVIVVGLGGMGSAVAAHAAQRGLRVLGLEQFDAVHDHGASSGESRLIRKAYFEDPAYVPMLLRAYELWRDLEARTGIDIMTITGILMVGEPDSEVLVGAQRSAQLHGLALEKLSRNDVCDRYPMVKMRAGEVAIFEADAGFVRPEAAIEAHLEVARAHGATLRFGARVSGWETAGDDGVNLTLTDGETVSARKLALCIGPWFVQHAAALGVQLRIQRNVQAWFRPADERFALGTLPAFFCKRPEYPTHMYGFPDVGNGVKAAFHGYGETTTPDALRRDVTDEEIEELRRALNNLLPESGGELLSVKACMYSLTPDEHFVISPQPHSANVVVAGGFSGHGYKFCSVVGEIVADLIENGQSRHDIAFLSPRRFAKDG